MVTGKAEAGVSVTVKLKLVAPELPSASVTSLIESAGSASSFLIVPTPTLPPIVAFTGPVRFTSRVSSGSGVTSPRTETVSVCVVWPAVKVTVPLFAVKSVPDVAVPLAVAKLAVTVDADAAERKTLNVIVALPAFPSTTCALPIVIDGVAGVLIAAHAENSDVLPSESVAVAVAKPPATPANVTLNVPTPDAAVVIVASPRYVCPSPAPDGSQAVFWKNCTMYVLDGALLSVPAIVTEPAPNCADEMTGKFCRSLNEPMSPSPASFGVMPSSPRSMPS